jgi:branched-chain amino acid transport system permease protein
VTAEATVPADPARSVREPFWREPRFRKVADIAGPAVVILALQSVIFPMPLGTYLYGMILGLLAALVALGMALIYRANRILNFAQGELGLVPTSRPVAHLLQPPALCGGTGDRLAAVVLLGGLVEFLVIRRFFRPCLILTVATIGLAQLLTLCSLALPLLWARTRSARTR